MVVRLVALDNQIDSGQPSFEDSLKKMVIANLVDEIVELEIGSYGLDGDVVNPAVDHDEVNTMIDWVSLAA